MATAPELNFLLDENLMRLEPVAFLDDGVFVKTHRDTDEKTSFVTQRGVVHPLRRLLRLEGLNQFAIRRNANAIRKDLQSEIERARAGNDSLELRYFTEQLAPAFDARDWTKTAPLGASPESGDPYTENDPSWVVAALSRGIPAAAWPIPSVMILGRLWSLRAAKSPGRGFHVRRGQVILAPSGEEVSAKAIEVRWRLAVIEWLTTTRAGLRVKFAQAESAELSLARAEIERIGHYQRGDVFFIPGSPPLVGHLTPPHFNRALGRNTQRDLAMVAPLILPPRITQPTAYVKSAEGRWGLLRLPHGMCLGPGPLADRPETPGLALLAFLRWAATRVADNGAFHASDLATNDNY